MQIKQLEKLLSIEEEGQKSDTKPGESMVCLDFFISLKTFDLYNIIWGPLQPSSKTIEELRAQVKTLTSQNEHKDALVKYLA